MSIIGIDTGGTFTDLVHLDGKGRTIVVKVPSTPRDPARAIAAGLARLAAAGSPGEPCLRLVHGTTVATNALLERRGASTALVTNAGFEDVLEIGRQARADLYALHVEREPPLVPAALRFGLGQRTLADGTEATRPSDEAVAALVGRLGEALVEAIAVSLLHSYRDPEPERRLGRALAGLGVPVSLSSDVLPEPREYERTATTVANAYLVPLLARYLATLEGLAPAGARFLVMRSDGGVASARATAREPVRTVLSGPAGGVVGAAAVAARTAAGPFVSFDVGGTSTDVALGGAALVAAGDVGGVFVAVPALDIHTVGAGGGSIAFRDPGGSLRVGPRSAGADPGPACYGRGDEPTLTDAFVVLGHLEPRFFLGGEMAIDQDRAHRAVERLGRALSLDARRTAEGIVEVALARTERAVRRVSVERGADPRERALVAFGGAGGLLGPALAARLGMRACVVPRHPGLLCALGMAGADIVRPLAATLLARADRLEDAEVERRFAALEAEVGAALRDEGFAPGEIEARREVDVRYEDQGEEIRVPYRRGAIAADFAAAHLERNGWKDERRPVEVVALRVTGVGRTRKTEPASPRPSPGGRAGPAGNGGAARAPGVYDRADLAPGEAVDGPAVVGEYSGTTSVPGGQRLTVRPTGDLWVEAAS